ncbi:hypothetical protein H4Q26_001577 [Puccinia striiformis f. sp. tritici PST-130]|nr:hypothetical protein H4Q26_001577 [Puccinia striiformis f. sp. tritici PST-130]
MIQSTSCRPFSLPAYTNTFELDPGESITIRLVSGTAEISGFELTIFRASLELVLILHSSTEYDDPQSITRHRKSITEYVAEESTVPAYMALHLASNEPD